MTTTIISSIHTQTVWPECIPSTLVWCGTSDFYNFWHASSCSYSSCIYATMHIIMQSLWGRCALSL